MLAEETALHPDLVIEIRDVVKTYRLGDVEVRALRGVSLAVERGEFLAIMGASGSGKSTLMNILGCLDQPTSGTYIFEGVDTAMLDEPALARIRSRRVGFVFQNFNLLPRTSAWENVALPLFYSGHSADGAARVRDALRTLGLAGREQSHPSQLSGGQQQRVAIARALINDPAVLLADEPTGNLDSKTAVDILTTLREFNRRRALTIVLVTHEPDMAAFADRVITMRDGAIVADERRAPHARAAAGPVPAPAALRRGGDSGGGGRAAIETAGAGVAQAAARGGRTALEAGAAAGSQGLGSAWSFTRMALSAAGRTLARNKLRSALTMLGIFIGVTALITMVAVGQGANAAVKRQIEGLGTNLVMIVPGAATSNGVRGGFGSASTLTVADAQAVKQDDPAVANVGYQIRGVAQVQAGNMNWSTSVQGVSPSYTDIRNWAVVAGRPLTDQDERDAARVALLGQTVVKNLFGAYENPVGATIFIKNVPVEVVGVLASRGQTGFGQDQDDTVLIPFTTAERKVLGVSAPSKTETSPNNPYGTPPNPFGVPPKLAGYVNVIFVQATSMAAVPTAIDEVTETLRRRHHIQPGDNDDFSARNLSDITQAAESSSRVMALLLVTVASISLLVGGIGIMNILLVSVTERTREIGIRMAIGARRVQVLVQFLVEAVLLSAIGGGIGVLMGVAVATFVSSVAGWPTLLSPAAMIGGFFFSGAVGIFFGYYPARRAARLNPIEALRFE